MSALPNRRPNRTLIKSALVMTVIGLGLTACQPAVPVGHGPAASASAMATAQQSQPVQGAGASAGATKPSTGGGTGVMGGGLRAGMLQAMPAGSVALQRGTDGDLVAKVDLFGLTPGSSHTAAIEIPGVTIFSPAVRFGTFTADATGQVHTTLTAQQSGSLPAGSRFSVHLGTFGGDFNRNPLAMELIAQSGPLPGKIAGVRTLGLHAVSFDPNGNNLGNPSGTESVTYDPAAHTLRITVTAHGLTPGAHAAHIHLGTCRTQGEVKYMLADFQADSRGDIVKESRTVTNVMTAPPTSGWYLNLHQGDMNSILSNGVPALSFRPLLCADLGPVPTVTSGHRTTTSSMAAMPAMPSNSTQGPAPQGSSTGG
ncbi:CHRD domain-containing protein [Streptomyces sp. NPDC005122]